MNYLWKSSIFYNFPMKLVDFNLAFVRLGCSHTNFSLTILEMKL